MMYMFDGDAASVIEGFCGLPPMSRMTTVEEAIAIEKAERYDEQALWDSRNKHGEPSILGKMVQCECWNEFAEWFVEVTDGGNPNIYRDEWDEYCESTR